MEENKINPEDENDCLKDVVEFQNNMFNPGHYIATGKIPPTVSATGNALPLAIVWFITAFIIFSLGLLLFFSEINVTSSGLIKSPVLNKIVALIIMSVVSLLCAWLGFAYLKKAKKYYKEKNTLEKERTDENIKDELWQRTCPKCGKSHDIDFPKCPYCNFDYLN